MACAHMTNWTFLRWLLLSFKREFEVDDSLRVFEVISSSYLELSTDQAMKESAKEAAKLFQKDGGDVYLACGYYHIWLQVVVLEQTRVHTTWSIHLKCSYVLPSCYHTRNSSCSHLSLVTCTLV